CYAQTAPGPKLGAPYELRPQRISLDVTADGIEMVIRFDGEGFIRSLIEMTIADALSKQSPASDVGGRQALHEVAELAVLARPEHEMPVVGHQTPGEYPQRNALGCLVHHPQKRQVIAFGFKDLAALVPA